jgi:hypothetical protein
VWRLKGVIEMTDDDTGTRRRTCTCVNNSITLKMQWGVSGAKSPEGAGDKEEGNG